MIGNVQNAVAAATFPAGLFTAFARSESYAVLGWDVMYSDGSNQRSQLGINPRYRWRLARRLPAAALSVLYEFYKARKGATEAFTFHDPLLNEDFTARFASGWEHAITLGHLANTAFEIVQVV